MSNAAADLARLEEAAARVEQATVEEVYAALYALASIAAEHLPGAAYLVLENSDQGPYQWVIGWAGATGAADMLTDEQGDLFDLPAMSLRDAQARLWGLFCKPDHVHPDSRRWLDLDLVRKARDRKETP